MPKKQSKKKASSLKLESFELYLIPGVIFAFVVVFGLLVLRPKVKEIFETQSRLDREELRLSRLTNKVDDLESLDQAELQEKVELTTKAVPLEKNVPKILIMMKNMSADHNVEIKQISVSPGELASESAKPKNEAYLSLNFEISTSADLESLKDYLAELQQVLPVMTIKEIDFKGGLVESVLTIGFPLDTPFLAPPEELQSMEKPLTRISEEEQDIYEKLTEFKQDYFLEKIEPVQTGKKNPFIY